MNADLGDRKWSCEEYCAGVFAEESQRGGFVIHHAASGPEVYMFILKCCMCFVQSFFM